MNSSNNNCSIIPQPVTENYKFQSLSTIFASIKKIKKGQMSPLNPLVVKYNNTNYIELLKNKFKYTFIYEFPLEDFLNPTVETVSRAKIISHDQLRLNFNTDLFASKHKIITPQYIKNNLNLSNRLSNQYGNKGITLGNYNDAIINALSEIIQKFPFNMANMNDFHPVFDVIDYLYTDVLGNKTIKTTTFGAIKYDVYNKSKKTNSPKVLFWGTGLQEFIVGEKQNI